MSLKIKNCCSRLFPDRAAALLAALLAAGLTGCSPAGQSTDTIRVGVALYTQDDTFISTIQQDMERLVRQRENEQQLKINLSTAYGRSNQTTQLEQVDRFLDQGCDVLCINVVDRTAAAVIVDKAQEAGVPLVFFNRQPVAEDIRRGDNIYYVGVQAAEAGRMQGQLVLEAWQTQRDTLDRNGDGVLQYVMLEGEPGHQDALLRTEYSVKALTAAGVEVEKLASDTANWNRAQGTAKTAQWIDRFGEGIEVVFSNNDDMALGAIDAFQEAELELPLVVGVDATAPALEAIRQGELYGTVLNDAEGIAEAMVDLSLALTRGEDPAQTLEVVDGHYIWLPCQKITAQDLEEKQQ